jgi:hypothetical protein
MLLDRYVPRPDVRLFTDRDVFATFRPSNDAGLLLKNGLLLLAAVIVSSVVRGICIGLACKRPPR